MQAFLDLHPRPATYLNNDDQKYHHPPGSRISMAWTKLLSQRGAQGDKCSKQATYKSMVLKHDQHNLCRELERRLSQAKEAFLLAMPLGSHRLKPLSSGTFLAVTDACGRGDAGSLQPASHGCCCSIPLPPLPQAPVHQSHGIALLLL